VISYEEAFSHSSVRFDGADDQAQETMPAADASSADGADLTDTTDNGSDAAAAIPGSETSQEDGRAEMPKKTRASRPPKQKKSKNIEKKTSDVAAKSPERFVNKSVIKSVEKSVQTPSESLPNTVKTEAASTPPVLASPEATKAPNSDHLNKTSDNLDSQSSAPTADTALNEESPGSPTPNQDSGLDPLASSPAPATADATSEPSHTSFSYLLMGGSLVLIGGLIGWFRIRRSKTTYLSDFDLNSEAENSAVSKLNTSKSATKKPRNEEPITSELNFADFSSQPSQLLSMAPSHTASKI
jgi:hypothetical protein